jgi:hypothetical protein
MGMFNEVFCKCPKEGCNGVGYMQISQIVLGFGGFSLQSPETLEELSDSQLRQLREYIVEGHFDCDQCGHRFNPYLDGNRDERQELIRKLIVP